jgi:hypothetical protein
MIKKIPRIVEVSATRGEAAESGARLSSQIDDILSRQRVTLESGAYPITMYLNHGMTLRPARDHQVATEEVGIEAIRRPSGA